MHAQPNSTATTAARMHAPVPVDEEAEAVVARCAVHTSGGARLAASRVTPAMMWVPRHRQLLQVAFALPAITGELAEDSRIAAAARQLGEPVDRLRAEVLQRPVLVDESGGYAARVVDAHERRRLLAAAEDVRRALAAGAPTDEVAWILQQVAA